MNAGKADDLVVWSRDGTAIHCRRTGSGPGLILVHGGLQTAGSFSQLAEHLGASFTVYAVDRRSRRPSGPAGEDYNLQKEVDDLRAVVARTGAAYVFGLSSGALIALQTALDAPEIAKIALYEPPLAITGARASAMAFIPDYEKALAAGNLAAAMVAILKGTDDPSFMTRLPGFILEPIFRVMLSRKTSGEQPSIAELVPTVRNDCILVREMAGTAERYRSLQAEVLLLGGDKSKPFLTLALDTLENILPHVSRVRLKGLGHLAAADDGSSDRVAAVLKRFFVPSNA